ncbi:Lecithin:cholesterol acyltransferase-domain-containing protein [Cladochytrium replicatum]|nr:Lecithin:cholesterol acyltransferase-domain-containing protein [Cladochytrium replicatum]
MIAKFGWIRSVGFFTGALFAILAGSPVQLFELLGKQSLPYYGNNPFASWIGIFPPGISIPNFVGPYHSVEPDPKNEFLIGTKLSQQGLAPTYPIIMIPGVVSTGLEVWSTGTKRSKVGHEKCGAKYFRKRMWGTLNQFKALLLDKECWLAHIKLDPETGLDPPGIRMRAAQGLDAADYLFPGYWVWAQIINNLAALGYDNNNMILASYDWRLSFQKLEKRDQYFSRLKQIIETAVDGDGGGVRRTAVIVSHSLGGSVFQYFLQWVQSPVGANAGSDWPDKYLHRWVNIAAPMLGVPKAHSALASGEIRETTLLSPFATYFAEKLFLSKRERVEMFRTLNMQAMFLKGGETFWGKLGEPAPDENVHPEHYSTKTDLVIANPMVRPRSTYKAAQNTNETTSREPNAAEYTALFASIFTIRGRNRQHNLCARSLAQFLSDSAGEPFRSRWAREWNHGLAKSKSEIERSKLDSSTWANPLIAPLPKFKSSENNSAGFKVYCIYGVGVRTERAYFYREKPTKERGRRNGQTTMQNWIGALTGSYALSSITSQEAQISPKASLDSSVATSPVPGKILDAQNGLIEVATTGDESEHPLYTIDNTVQGLARDVENGVALTDGDGTVPLISLGYMCTEGWRRRRYNPSGVPVVTREYRDIRPENRFPSLRGGPQSSDHVDIMGNHGVIEDIMRIVGGQDDQLHDNIISQIQDTVKNIKLPF